MDETWASPAGYAKYEVSTDGYGPDQRPVRSIDRIVNGRRIKGVLLKTKVGTHGYLEVKVYDDTGKQQTRTVHGLVMLAHVGPCPPGMTVRHLDDNPFNNRWRPGREAVSRAAGGNLIYGTRPEQEEDRYRNGRPRPVPRPVRFCACGAVLKTNGKRCHECVVALGVAAAGMLRAGRPVAEVARALDYPSADGLLKLAVTHGGFGVEPERARWTQRVKVTLRRILPRRGQLQSVTTGENQQGNSAEGGNARPRSPPAHLRQCVTCDYACRKWDNVLQVCDNAL